MKNEVRYEWVIEILELEDDPEYGPQIVEVNHADTYADALKFARDIPRYHIGLVRDEGNDVEGLVDRAWAYMEDGKLPERFTEGLRSYEVQKKFHKEVEDES